MPNGQIWQRRKEFSDWIKEKKPSLPKLMDKNALVQDTWLAQLKEHATLDLRVMSSSPMLGVEIIKNK